MKKILLVIFALLVMAGLAACKPGALIPEPPDPNYPYPVEYSTLSATILERPEKVVSLSPSLTEIIYDMGLEERLAGVSENCDYPSQASRLTQCGTAQNPDLAAIKAISPQVVVASAPLADSDLTVLQQMGAEVAILPRAKDLEQLKALYQAIGGIFDGKEAGIANAESFYKPLYRQMEGISNGVSTLEERLDAIYLAQPYYTIATGDTFEGKLLEEIGYHNAAGSYSSWIIPEEARGELNPGIVFYNDEIDLNKLISNVGYNTSKALTDETFYEMNLPAMERQGVRMFKELLNMLSLGYPDLDVTPPPEPVVEGEEGEGEASSSQNEEPQDFEGGVAASKD